MKGDDDVDSPWPLERYALTPSVLNDFSGISLKAIAQAFSLELLSADTLAILVSSRKLEVNEKSLLRVFLRTAGTFDRRRDLQDELDRIATIELSNKPELWCYLARLVINRYPEAGSALRHLGYVYDALGSPPALLPYTYLPSNAQHRRTPRAIIDELNLVLTAMGV